MMLRDWREADLEVLRSCYERERTHWLEALAWDTSWTWQIVEQARVALGLPGFLAIDSGNRVRGWTFFVVEDGRLHVGGIVADDEATTRALVEGIVATAQEAAVTTVACFILDRAAGLRSALAGHGFEIEPYLYLSRSLARMRDTGIEARGEAWRSEDLPAAADLLASAYTANAARHFAPDGCWERYVTSLISQAGCGTFDPALTRVVRDGVKLAALIVVTSVAPATAHIAQIAVRPDRRGAGLARALVAGAAEQAAAAGNTTLTLLVGDENVTARRLYESMGFAARATFVATTGTKWRTARYVA